MDSTRSRLKWRCRRGMRELDLVVGAYLAQRYDDADDGERATFERLLELADPVLFGYLTDREPAPDARLARLIDVLKTLRDT